MNLRTSLSRVAALALIAAPIAVIAGPTGSAQAATPVATTVTLTAASPAVDYGETADLVGAVKDSSGSSVYYGTVELQARPYGSSTWTTVATDTASGYVSFDVKPTISTAYQLKYDGYTSTSEYQDSYRGSTSAAVAQGVARKLSVKSKGLHLWGKVKPATKIKLVFKKKVHGKYKKWFKVKTSKKGKWSAHIHGAVGTKAEIILPSSGGYIGAVQKGSII